ncbi:MAG: hypothetical protein RR461_02595 [Angelakisella sp.]
MSVTQAQSTQTQPTQAQVCEQVAIIDQTLHYLQQIVIAIFLSYFTVTIQREQLICTICPEKCCDCLPDIFPIKIISSLLTLTALVFFYQLAVNSCCQPATDCAQQQSKQIGYLASALVLIAAVIRFFELIAAHQQ